MGFLKTAFINLHLFSAIFNYNSFMLTSALPGVPTELQSSSQIKALARSACPRFPSHDPAYTSASLDDKTALKQWMIVSEWNVSQDWFDAYIGKYNTTDCFNTYTRMNHFPNFHIANMFLTVQNAQSLAKHTNITAVGLSTMSISADSVEERAGVPYGPNPQLDILEPAAPHLQILSRDPNNAASMNSEGYLQDPSLGEGISVYVLDSGYNSDHEEYKDRPLNNIHPWSAPPIHSDEEGVTEDFESFGSDYDQNIYWDEMSWDDNAGYYEGHGNSVASIIGGATIGVVPRADLFIVRWTIPTRNPETQRYEVPSDPDPAHLTDAMEYIIEDVGQLGLGEPKNKKAVVNFSYTFQISSGPRLDEYGFTRDVSLAAWEKFAEQCKDNQIILVWAAGNWGNYWYRPDSYPPPKTKPTDIDNPQPYSLDFAGPSSLGTDDNEYITVGGVEFNGTLFFRTTPRIAANGGAGSITISALADNVKKARNARLEEIPGATEQTKIGFDFSGGTSLAAPSISGLVAYLLGLNNPDMDSVRNADNFNLAVKQKIIDMGHQLRTQPPLYGEGGAILNFPADHLNYGNDIVSTLLTGYNGAYDGFCTIPRSSPSRIKRSNNTSSNDSQIQQPVDLEQFLDYTKDVNATASSFPVLRDHQFISPIGDYELTGCSCMANPNGFQDGINCADPMSLNKSQSTTAV